MGIVETVYQVVWGPPLLILLIGVSLYLTVALRGLQFRYLFYSLKIALGFEKTKKGKGDLSHFEALMTALSASMGIGNIAGVATAITLGGPGALFWMWVTALLGMATKFAEAILAIKFRTMGKNGQMSGGPMYFIEQGLGWKSLACAFALLGSLAALGGGNMIQANSVADVMQSVCNVSPLESGILCALIIGITLLGGIHSIGKLASLLVPFMALLYLSGGVAILAINYAKLPHAFGLIFSDAFSGKAAVGGLLATIQVGISRGLMTSEAGLGTASIAAAASQADHPGRGALVSMTGAFLTTIVLCSITGLVITTTIDNPTTTGATLTASAFDVHIPYGSAIVAVSLFLFAFTTLLGWAYYGEKCTEYLLGPKSVPIYRILFTLTIIPGAMLKLQTVWILADIFNGLMAIPNLLGLLALSGITIAETRSFIRLLEAERDPETAVS